MSLFAFLCGAWGHPTDPLIVMKGPQAYWECRRCCTELAPVLSGQMFPMLPLQPLKAVVGTAKDRDLAGVVTLAKWSKR